MDEWARDRRELEQAEARALAAEAALREMHEWAIQAETPEHLEVARRTEKWSK
jgi:hypothetical protein